MSTLVQPELSGETLAQRALALRPTIVRSHHSRHRRSLSYDDVDDLYGRALVVLLEKDPPPVFHSDVALRAWLDETMRRSALKLSQSAHARLASGATGTLDERPSQEATPEQRALIAHEHDTIEEYIAGLAPVDQLIALLHLWPSSQMTAKKIAAEYDLPLAEVRASIHRITTNWRRYTALSVGTVCRKQMKYLERWQRDGGPIPLQLMIHARRCSGCRETILTARQRSYDALQPLAPILGPPLAVGALAARMGSGLSLHVRAVTSRVARSLVKLASAGKEAGGSVLLAGKTAAVVAVAATATAGVATVGIVAAAAGDHHRLPDHVVRAAASGAVSAPSAPAYGSGSGAAASSLTTAASSAAPGTASDDAAPTGGQDGAADRLPGSAASPSVTAAASVKKARRPTTSKPARADPTSSTVGTSGSSAETSSPTEKTAPTP